MNRMWKLAGLALLLASCTTLGLPEPTAEVGAQAVTCAVWSAGAVYTGGDTVTHEGATYKANWWTQGNNPATSSGGPGSGQPWTKVASCGGATTPTPPNPTPPTPPTPTPQPPVPPTSPNTSGYKRVGYFVQWGIYARNFRLADMDKSGAAATLTHLNYAFGGITPDGQCTVTTPNLSDSFADYGKAFTADQSVDGVADVWDQKLKGNFNQLKELKTKYPGLKVLISLGGWTWSRNFSDVALTDAARKKFVSSCVDIYIRGNLPLADGAGGPGAAAGVFDGIDIDWEYPGSEGNTGNIVRAEDTRNFTLLLEEFRRQLDAAGSGKLLTAALPAAPPKVGKLEVGNIARSLDLMNVMTYDFRGGWATSGPTNFHSNLYPDPASPGGAEEKTWSVDTAVNAYLRAGAPAKKLVVGVPYYGRGWRGVGGANNGLYQSAAGLPQGEYEAGIDNYNILVNKPGTVYRNSTTKQMWKFDGNEFWSYDDPEVLTTKMTYIKERGLGGSMAWSMDGEDKNATLSKTIYNALR